MSIVVKFPFLIYFRKNSSGILTVSRKAIQACEKIKNIPLPNHSGYIVGGNAAGKGKKVIRSRA